MNKFGINSWLLGGRVKSAKVVNSASGSGVRLQIEVIDQGGTGNERIRNYNAVVWDSAQEIKQDDFVVLNGSVAVRKYVKADGTDGWSTECAVNGKYTSNVQVLRVSDTAETVVPEDDTIPF